MTKLLELAGRLEGTAATLGLGENDILIVGLTSIERGLIVSALKASEDEACEYCGPGKVTGLPGNACENCMNTGLKHPAPALNVRDIVRDLRAGPLPGSPLFERAADLIENLASAVSNGERA